MARDAQAAGLPPELPVMASLVESGLHNLTGGDRDSVGFFQMRTGIWDRGAYAGFQQNPELQMRWFIDHALAIKARRIAEGDATYGQDPSTYGNWVADVEVPYEPYRGRYQLRLDDARALLAQAGPAPPPATGVPAVADAAAAGAAPAVPAADVAGPVIDIAPGVPVMDAQAASPTALNAIRIAAQYLGHAVPLRRRLAGDRVRLLGTHAVGVLACRRLDPARDVRPDRRRDTGRPRPPRAGRPRLLPARRRRPPRRHVPRRGALPAGAPHRRCREGLEPRRAVLRRAVRRRPPHRLSLEVPEASAATAAAATATAATATAARGRRRAAATAAAATARRAATAARGGSATAGRGRRPGRQEQHDVAAALRSTDRERGERACGSREPNDHATALGRNVAVTPWPATRPIADAMPPCQSSTTLVPWAIERLRTRSPERSSAPDPRCSVRVTRLPTFVTEPRRTIARGAAAPRSEEIRRRRNAFPLATSTSVIVPSPAFAT